MATANTRMTLGALLATVQQSANTVSATLTAANQSVGMITAAIGAASERQSKRIVLDNAIFAATLHQDKAKELAESRKSVDEYCAQSQRHKDLYEEAYAELGNILNPTK